MSSFARGIFVTLALGSAGVGAAADAPPAGPVPPGWYVAPMLTYMQPDSARCNVDGGFGGSLMAGHRGDIASLEVWAQYLSLSHGGCSYLVPGPATPADPNDDERVRYTEPAGSVDLNGGGIGVVFGGYGESPVIQRFFGVIGFGVLLRRGHPQYTANDSTIFGDAGLGYAHPLQLFGRATSLRSELRYRLDVQQPPYPDASEQDPPPEHKFADLILNVGLQFGLSPAPEAAPVVAAEPVTVVAVADADGDSVPDDSDQCPDTAPGAAADATGCVPAPLPPAEVTLETAKAGDTIVLHGVNFETARSTLTANAQTILDQIAEKLVARPGLKVEIGGHTDSRGADNYNQLLSEQRAQSVMTYLTDKGVAADALSAVGYGEAQPADTNETDEGRERNRRVELKVLEGSPPTAQTPAATPAETTMPTTTTSTPGEAS